VIGLFWLGHHGIFRHVVALDRPLISINLLFLGTIALLPYPTALLNVTSNPNTAGIVFYAICTAASIRLRYALRIGRVPVVFLASIPVAFAAPQDAPYIWTLIIVTGPVINRFVRSPTARSAATSSRYQTPHCFQSFHDPICPISGTGSRAMLAGVRETGGTHEGRSRQSVTRTGG